MKKRGQSSVQFDEIGYWSEIKLDIVREYATAYSTIIIGAGEAEALPRVC